MESAYTNSHAILFAKDAKAAHWQLGPLPPGQGSFVVIGWTMEDPNGGVPGQIIDILARAFARCGRVTFPCSKADGASPGWSPRGSDSVGAFSSRQADGRMSFRRWLSAIGASLKRRRLPLLSTSREEAVRDLFDDAAFPWRLQGQFALISGPATSPPEFGRDFELPGGLFEDEWADSLQELSATGVEAIIRPGVDGDVIGAVCSSIDVRHKIEDNICRVANELEIGCRQLSEEAFATALASVR